METSKFKGTVVVYPMDAFGHIHPLMYIAKEMLDRQYRVIVLSTREASWTPRLRKMGLEVAHCVDGHIEKSDVDFTKLVETNMDPDPIQTFVNVTSKEGFIYRHLEDLHAKHDLIEAKLRDLKPDLILVDGLLSVPCVAKLGCPYATLYPACPTGVYNFFNRNCVCSMGLPLDEMTPEIWEFCEKHLKLCTDMVYKFYEKHGIKVSRTGPRFVKIGLSSSDLNFYLGPREIGYDITGRFKPLPKSWHLLEHTIKRTPAELSVSKFELPESLRNLPGKLIYISLGTVASGNPTIINRLLPILSKSPNKFIVSKGPKAENVELYPNMWGDAFLNQNAILSVVDMFITHCGHNSTIEAFYHGVPSIIALPAFGDQLDIAQRLQECGLGKRLNVFTCTEEELLGAIESQLANEEAKRRMKEIGERLRSIDYPSIAADKLEELLTLRKNGICNQFDI